MRRTDFLATRKAPSQPQPRYYARHNSHHVQELEVRIAALQLRDPAHAARADRAPRRQLVKRLPRLPLLHNEAVDGVLAVEDRAERAPLRERRGHIFQAVHEHVDVPRLQRDLELLRPQRLPADQVERL